MINHIQLVCLIQVAPTSIYSKSGTKPGCAIIAHTYNKHDTDKEFDEVVSD